MVQSNGAGIPGASVTAGGLSVTTDANGVYTFNNIPSGAISITASAATFQTVSETVNVAGRRHYDGPAHHVAF